MRILQRNKIAPVNLMPGDTLSVVYREGLERTELIRHVVDLPLSFDTVLVVEDIDGLGLETSLAGVIGREETP